MFRPNVVSTLLGATFLVGLTMCQGPSDPELPRAPKGCMVFEDGSAVCDSDTWYWEEGINDAD